MSQSEGEQSGRRGLMWCGVRLGVTLCTFMRCLCSLLPTEVCMPQALHTVRVTISYRPTPLHMDTEMGIRRIWNGSMTDSKMRV